MSPPKIDMHSHFLPPFYRAACLSHGHANPDGMPYLPEWDPTTHLALMDKLHITKSILSISSPGTHLVPSDPTLAISLTRQCNAYAADLKKSNPTRFGYFASLPLPDIDASINEIPKALEEGCDGFVLLTNAHGHYLGDEIYEPVFKKLDAAKALIFIHPTTPTCCAARSATASTTPMAAAPLAGKYVNPMLEFPFDTARAITNLFLSGTLSRHTNLRIILPHLGGAFPPLLSRWTVFSTMLPGPYQAVSEADVCEALKKNLWLDLAGVVLPSQLRGLMGGVGVGADRLVYGSDYPFTRAEGVGMLLGMLEKGGEEVWGGGEEVSGMVWEGNAKGLLGEDMVRE